MANTQTVPEISIIARQEWVECMKNGIEADILKEYDEALELYSKYVYYK